MGAWLRASFLMAFSLLVWAAAPSQKRAPTVGHSRRVFVSVTDTGGASILDLTPADFEVTESARKRRNGERAQSDPLCSRGVPRGAAAGRRGDVRQHRPAGARAPATDHGPQESARPRKGALFRWGRDAAPRRNSRSRRSILQEGGGP